MRTRSEDGFSILTVLMALALISILFCALADMITVTTKSQRNALIRAEFENLTATLRGALAGEDTCLAALGGNGALDALVVSDPVTPARKLAGPGLRHEAGWTFTRVALEQSVDVPGHPELRRGQLRIEARKDPRITLGAPLISRTVGDVYYERGTQGASAGEIIRCFTDPRALAAENECIRLGGTWQGDKQAGAQCIVFAHKGEGK
jgi:hypothetical protein